MTDINTAGVGVLLHLLSSNADSATIVQRAIVERVVEEAAKSVEPRPTTEFETKYPNTCADLLKWAEITHRLLERGIDFGVLLEGLRTADSLVRTGEPD